MSLQMEMVARDDLFTRDRVNIAQAATIAGVHRNTIYNWMRLGRIDVVRTPTGQIRIYADSLLKREPDTD
jgi:predicted site-specific integrase-resolvase